MKRLIALVSLSAVCLAAHAEVSITDPWVRGTVPQQTATGAFMHIKSSQAARLVGVSSPHAASVELHEMVMEKDVMKMREVSSIDLPAGATVALQPGGYHIMLMGLKKQAKDGQSVDLVLDIEGPDKKRSKVKVKAMVKPLGDHTAAHGSKAH